MYDCLSFYLFYRRLSYFKVDTISKTMLDLNIDIKDIHAIISCLYNHYNIQIKDLYLYPDAYQCYNRLISLLSRWYNDVKKYNKIIQVLIEYKQKCQHLIGPPG